MIFLPRFKDSVRDFKISIDLDWWKVWIISILKGCAVNHILASNDNENIRIDKKLLLFYHIICLNVYIFNIIIIF